MDGSALELTSSPDWLAFDLSRDGAQVRMLRLNAEVYLQESFLDERVVPLNLGDEWIAADDLEAAFPASSPRADFIFHMGYVGSTLLSRLLGHCDDVFSVREPLALRTLALLARRHDSGCAGLPPELLPRVDLLLKLWSRTYQPPERALLKATSFVSEIAPLLLERAPSAHALLMFVSPQVYIAGVLAGSAHRQELERVTQARLTRLTPRFGEPWVCGDLSDGERAAVGWVTEILALAETAEAHPARTLWVDFEHFLGDPPALLTRILGHLGRRADPSTVARLAAQEEFGRYAKAPEYRFSPNDRRSLLDQSMEENAAEIDRGLEWLNAAARRYPAVGAAAVTARQAA